jgi:D-alanyl-lipoteichoic acid acyltransferase DltB (MBOAT superfamily)
MLFNSPEFLFVFLPLAILGFGLAYRKGGLEAAWLWLAIASLFFYSWWNPVHTPLLVGSVVCNYWLGKRLSQDDHVSHRWMLTAGVFVNLGLLAWFKYWHATASWIASCIGLTWEGPVLELPLGISFYTFHQLTYLWYCRSNREGASNFKHYLLYVTFFPQLIAGPIVRPKELLPQLSRSRSSAFRSDDIALGVTVFGIGLFKKMIIADHVSQWVSPVFASAGGEGAILFLDAWTAALSYTFQLYFDFSGYSDMAIGLACLFGVRLPGNFFSPYRSLSVIEFWRRWHITLSLFLRDYLYISLGGNRKGQMRTFANLLIVMVIGGFWHGAGWTFGVWGLYHGVCLLINHAWSRMNFLSTLPKLVTHGCSWSLTFAVTVIGWVVFRSPDMTVATRVLSSMFGGCGIDVPSSWLARMPWLESFGIGGSGSWVVFSGPVQTFTLFMLLAATLLLPNTLQLISGSFTPPNSKSIPTPKLPPVSVVWTPNIFWACAAGLMFALSILKLGHISEFLYFQF